MKKKVVSIIIPTYNSSSSIEALLQSIQRQTFKNIETIVVDNNSTDKTKQISRKYTKQVFNKGPERSAQRNYGAQKATGEYLLFIDSDMVLTPNVVSDCIKIATQKNTKMRGIIIPEESIGTGFWAQAKRLERQLILGIDWLEAPRFFSKKTFDEFHGYDEKNTGTEDYDLPQRIKTKYGEDTIMRIDSFIQHNEGHLSLSRTMKKKFYYASYLGNYK